MGVRWVCLCVVGDGGMNCCFIIVIIIIVIIIIVIIIIVIIKITHTECARKHPCFATERRCVRDVVLLPEKWVIYIYIYLFIYYRYLFDWLFVLDALLYARTIQLTLINSLYLIWCVKNSCVGAFGFSLPVCEWICRDVGVCRCVCVFYHQFFSILVTHTNTNSHITKYGLIEITSHTHPHIHTHSPPFLPHHPRRSLRRGAVVEVERGWV